MTETGATWPSPEDLAFNGPFKVASYTPNDSMVFVRNDNYADEQLAYHRQLRRATD